MSDNITVIGKAQPIFGSGQVVPSVTIRITDSLPVFATLAEQDAYHDAQATTIETALIESLPGGTYDRLVGRMLERKASHYRVAYGAGG
jgi:hypothetical protein